MPFFYEQFRDRSPRRNSSDSLSLRLDKVGLPPVQGTIVASLHLVKIQEDLRTHYHKKMTEIYLVLEGEGQMANLDGELIPVKPMTAICIRPGCRHRAIGNLTIVNIPIPAFDETDEWFD